jgi:hypothetical protein
VRIVFAKNRTCQSDAYALSLASLIDVLPGEDKTYAYRGRHDAADCARRCWRRAGRPGADRRRDERARGRRGGRAEADPTAP